MQSHQADVLGHRWYRYLDETSGTGMLPETFTMRRWQTCIDHTSRTSVDSYRCGFVIDQETQAVYSTHQYGLLRRRTYVRKKSSFLFFYLTFALHKTMPQLSKMLIGKLRSWEKSFIGSEYILSKKSFLMPISPLIFWRFCSIIKK